MTDEEERARISRIEWRIDQLDSDRKREADEWREARDKYEARIKSLEKQGYYARLGVGVAIVIGWIAVYILNIGELIRAWAGK